VSTRELVQAAGALSVINAAAATIDLTSDYGDQRVSQKIVQSFTVPIVAEYGPAISLTVTTENGQLNLTGTTSNVPSDLMVYYEFVYENVFFIVDTSFRKNDPSNPGTWVTIGKFMEPTYVSSDLRASYQVLMILANNTGCIQRICILYKITC
jgi:hypothetical protein